MDLPLIFTVSLYRHIIECTVEPLSEQAWVVYKKAGGGYDGLRAIQASWYIDDDLEQEILDDEFHKCDYREDLNVGIVEQGEEVASYIIFPESKYYNALYPFTQIEDNVEGVLEHVYAILSDELY